MSTLDQVLKEFRQSNVSGAVASRQDISEALEADWFQKFLAETLAGIEHAEEGERDKNYRTPAPAAQVSTDFYAELGRPTGARFAEPPAPQPLPQGFRFESASRPSPAFVILLQLRVFEAAEKERRRELVAREELIRSDVARQIQAGIQLLDASWFPAAVNRLRAAGVSFGDISIMAGYSGRNGKRDTEKFLEHGSKVMDQTKWRRDQFRVAFETWERTGSIPPRPTAKPETGPTDEGADTKPDATKADDAAGSQPNDSPGGPPPNQESGDARSEQRREPDEKQWCVDTVSRLRAAGVSNAEISKMVGYSGHNGKRDVDNFLKHVVEGEVRAKERIVKLRLAVEEWEAAQLNRSKPKEPSTETSPKPESAEASPGEETGGPQAADAENHPDSNDGKSQEERGAPRQERTETSGNAQFEADWAEKKVRGLRAAGVSNAEISKMAWYSGHNGKRDVENFLRQVRDGEVRAQERLAKFRRAVEEWEAAQPHRSDPKEPSAESNPKPASAEGKGVPPEKEPDDSDSYSESTSSGSEQEAGHRKSSHSGSRRKKSAGSAKEQRQTPPPEEESQRVDPSWFRESIDTLRDAGISYGEISKMAGYSGHNGKRDVATFLKHLLDDDARSRGRIKKFRRAMEHWTRRRFATPAAFSRILLEEKEEEGRENLLEEEFQTRRCLILDNNRNVPGAEWLWIPTMVERLRDSGVSWGDLSKMVGYSGRNGMRDLQSFLRHLKDRDEKIAARINAFRDAVAKWEAAARKAEQTEEGHEAGESDDDENPGASKLLAVLRRLQSEEEEARRGIVSGEQFMRQDIEKKATLSQPATWLRKTVDRLRASGVDFKELSQMAGFSGQNGERDLDVLRANVEKGADLWRMEPFWKEVAKWDRNRAAAFAANALRVEQDEAKVRQEIVAETSNAIERRLRDLSNTERFWVPLLVDRLRDHGMGWSAISQMAGYSGGKGKRDVESFLKQVQSGNENAKSKVDKFRAEYAAWEGIHLPANRPPPPATPSQPPPASTAPKPAPVPPATHPTGPPKGFFFPAPPPPPPVAAGFTFQRPPTCTRCGGTTVPLMRNSTPYPYPYLGQVPDLWFQCQLCGSEFRGQQLPPPPALSRHVLATPFAHQAHGDLAKCCLTFFPFPEPLPSSEPSKPIAAACLQPPYVQVRVSWANLSTAVCVDGRIGAVLQWLLDRLVASQFSPQVYQAQVEIGRDGRPTGVCQSSVAAVDCIEVMKSLNQRVLFDWGGVWFAADGPQISQLTNYCHWLQKLPFEQRSAKLAGLPAAPLSCELAMTVTKMR